MPVTLNPSTEIEPVRRFTTAGKLADIEEQIQESIRFQTTQPAESIERRIRELRCEWSIERYLQANVATLGAGGALLGLVRNKHWAWLTAGALGFFLFHALKGFDPPLPLLRRLGVRTRSEIDREIYALKALRGDFQDVVPEPRLYSEETADRVLAAVAR